MPLIIPLKAPPRYDLKEPLSQWLDGPHDEGSPMEYVCTRPKLRSIDCQKDLTRLAAVRNSLSGAITKSEAHRHALDEFGLQDCHEYHAVLLAFEEKGFPTCDEASPLELTWKAAVSPQKEKHGSLVWDRACTLWNISALESFLAAQQGVDKDGRKQAIKHYQNASACMRYLQEAIEGQSFETVDMNKSLMQFWERAMLAKAQIAAYDMVATSPGKHAMLSYLAMGAVPVLNEALTHAKDPLVVSNLPNLIEEWAAECKAESMLMTARAEYHQSVVNREAQEWGKEIARLAKAQSHFKECVDFLKSSDMDSALAETILRLVIDRKRQALIDNNTYQDDIPDEVPGILAKLLAKNDGEMPETMTKPKVPLFIKREPVVAPSAPPSYADFSSDAGPPSYADFSSPADEEDAPPSWEDFQRQTQL
jgi:hypothetical protein